MISSLFVTGRRRFLGESRNSVWPEFLGADIQFDERFDAVADHRPRVFADRALHRPLIVVNEQSTQVRRVMCGFLF